MLKTRPTATGAIARGIIDRFIAETRRRCEWYGEPARRTERRLHRTWPLSVVHIRGDVETQTGVALYNASSGGIAFLGPHAAEPGETLQIQLFWHDDHCPRVRAIVRHCTARNDRYLIGCEFVAGACDGE